MHLCFSTSPTGFFCDMVSPSLLSFPLLFLVLLRNLLLYVFLVFILLYFIYFFQSVLDYCHFCSSFYPPTFDLVLLSCFIPQSSVSDHHLTLVFFLFPFFVFFGSYVSSFSHFSLACFLHLFYFLTHPYSVLLSVSFLLASYLSYYLSSLALLFVYGLLLFSLSGFI
jgi:hypothetical protein